MNDKYIKLEDAIRSLVPFSQDRKHIRERMLELPTVEVPQWIPCSERMPDCEQEVVVTVKRTFFYGNEKKEHVFTCYAFYEDGEMWNEESSYYWEYDNDNWDEERDDFKVEKGWYESVSFEDTFSKFDSDCEVLAWIETAEPYKAGENE